MEVWPAETSIKSGSHDISDLACDLIRSLSVSSQSNNKQQIIDKKALDKIIYDMKLYDQSLQIESLERLVQFGIYDFDVLKDVSMKIKTSQEERYF